MLRNAARFFAQRVRSGGGGFGGLGNEGRRGMSTDSAAAVPKKPRRWARNILGSLAVLTVGGSGYAMWNRMRLAEIEMADDDDTDLVDGVKKKRVVVLGTGWGAVPILKNIDTNKYEVICVSPRNYFLMTPLLPSVAVGTVETRTVCESIRSLSLGKRIKYVEAEATDIDPKNKVIRCNKNTELHGDLDHRRTSAELKLDPGKTSSSRAIQDSTRARPNFELEYDYLVVAIGAENQTFNTPGVTKHAHFLKELPDARRIRAAVSDAFESAVQPGQTEEERKRLLHFVVVGGGPTGVEFAAELNDLVNEDLRHFHHKLVRSDVRISLIEALPTVLGVYDKTVQEYTMKHFKRENIDVLANTFVKEVRAEATVVQKKGEKQLQEIPCALVVWATGIKTRPIINNLMKAIGDTVQTNRRALLTDQYLEVKGAPGMYALGDCATIEVPKMLASVKELFEEGDVIKDNALSLEEFHNLVKSKRDKYPQLEFYIDSIENAFAEGDTNKDGKLSLEEFTKLLERIDKKIKILPATAQVANQEGIYLAKYLNAIEADKDNAKETFKPFRYRHMGSLAYIGSDEAIIDLTGTSLFNIALGGRNAFFLWRSFYFTECFTARTKLLLFADWLRAKIFGRDISRV